MLTEPAWSPHEPALDLSVIANLLKGAAAVALAVFLVVYLVQDRLIFFPQAPTDARRAEITARYPAVRALDFAATDGTRLHAWQVRIAGSAAPTVLYFGGNAEEVSVLLDAVGDPVRGATPGVNWLLLDYRGYGASAGSPSEKNMVADALALYDHVVADGAEPARLFAFGRSLGSGVAVALAAQRGLAGVVLVTPYDSIVSVAQRHYPLLPVNWLLRHRFDSLALAPQLRAPLLCAMAGRDEVIPSEHAERLFAAWAGPKQRLLFATAGHNDVDADPRFWAAVRDFLETKRA